MLFFCPWQISLKKSDASRGVYMALYRFFSKKNLFHQKGHKSTETPSKKTCQKSEKALFIFSQMYFMLLYVSQNLVRFTMEAIPSPVHGKHALCLYNSTSVPSYSLLLRFSSFLGSGTRQLESCRISDGFPVSIRYHALPLGT